MGSKLPGCLLWLHGLLQSCFSCCHSRPPPWIRSCFTVCPQILFLWNQTILHQSAVYLFCCSAITHSDTTWLQFLLYKPIHSLAVIFPSLSPPLPPSSFPLSPSLITTVVNFMVDSIYEGIQWTMNSLWIQGYMLLSFLMLLVNWSFRYFACQNINLPELYFYCFIKLPNLKYLVTIKYIESNQN